MVINGGMDTSLLTATPDRPATRATPARILVRDVDGLEVPAPGVWPLLAASAIRRRRGPTTIDLPIHQGWLEVADDPRTSWMRIDTDDVLLETTSAIVAPHAFEASAWQLDGIAEGAGARRPLRLDLVYCGVFRRAGRTWAWFTGSGHIGDGDAHRRFRRPEVDELSVDLLFSAGR